MCIHLVPRILQTLVYSTGCIKIGNRTLVSLEKNLDAADTAKERYYKSSGINAIFQRSLRCTSLPTDEILHSLKLTGSNTDVCAGSRCLIRQLGGDVHIFYEHSTQANIREACSIKFVKIFLSTQQQTKIIFSCTTELLPVSTVCSQNSSPRFSWTIPRKINISEWKFQTLQLKECWFYASKITFSVFAIFFANSNVKWMSVNVLIFNSKTHCCNYTLTDVHFTLSLAKNV